MSSSPADVPLVSWKDGPDGRGTYDILSLCISTLLICVWNAVHMDIPTRTSFWNVHVKRVGWLVGGLVLPEMLVLTALGQFVKARQLVASARRHLPAAKQPTAVPWWKTWTRRCYLWLQFAFPKGLAKVRYLPLIRVSNLTSHNGHSHLLRKNRMFPCTPPIRVTRRVNLRPTSPECIPGR